MTALQQLLLTGRFSCPACDRRFHLLAAKEQHLRTEHPKQRAADS